MIMLGIILGFSCIWLALAYLGLVKLSEHYDEAEEKKEEK